MIDVAILYSRQADGTFDFDDYRQRHMPMVVERMAGACSGFAIERGLAGATPDTPPAFTAIGHLYFESVDAFVAAFAPHAADIAADVSRYTNIAPSIQISDVVARPAGSGKTPQA